MSKQEKEKGSLAEQLKKLLGGVAKPVDSVEKAGPDREPAQALSGRDNGFRNVRSGKPVNVAFGPTGRPRNDTPKSVDDGKKQQRHKAKNRHCRSKRNDHRASERQPTQRIAAHGIASDWGTGQSARRRGMPEQAVAPELAVSFSGEPSLHPLLAEIGAVTLPRIMTSSDGASLQAPGYVGRQPGVPSRDMVLAVDFGTSTTKVVVRDTLAESKGISFAVPFFDAPAEARYLQPSHIAKLGDIYTLDIDNMVSVSRNLKLGLLHGNSEEHVLADAVGFLALVIRHARAWFYDLRAAEMRNATLIWRVVLGLPAADFGNEALRARYLKIACAAVSLAASQAKIGFDSALQAWREANPPPDARNADQSGQRVELIPEIVAQISGHVRSQFYDRAADPLMMVIDVGAGTLDAVVFNQMMNKGKLNIFAFGCSVEEHGAAMLHRHRVNSLVKAIKPDAPHATEGVRLLASTREPTDLPRLPDSVDAYLTNMSITPDSGQIDTHFSNEFGKQIYSRTIAEAKKRNPANPAWGSLPVFLCGGGSRMPLFAKYPERTFNRSSTKIRMEVKRLPMPERFRADGIGDDDYHRLSVAYGLSVHQLGTYLRPEEIDEIAHVDGDRARQVVDTGDNQN